MQPRTRAVRIAAAFAAVALAACQAPPEQDAEMPSSARQPAPEPIPEAPPPTSGTWTGENISFNVSADGTKLTTAGSTLEESRSLVVEIMLEPNQFGMSKQTRYLYVDIPITDGAFHLSDGELEIDGQLHSPTEASGIFRLVGVVQQPGQFGTTTGTVRGSGKWSATATAASVSNDPGSD